MKNLTNLKTAFVVGVVATFVMTLASLLSHHIRLPNADFHSLITTFFKTGDVGTWVIYFGLGIAVAHMYREYVSRYLPYRSWKKGIIYSVFLWVVMMVVVMPMAGMNVFAGSMLTASGMLFALAFYGGLVGYMYDRS